MTLHRGPDLGETRHEVALIQIGPLGVCCDRAHTAAVTERDEWPSTLTEMVCVPASSKRPSTKTSCVAFALAPVWKVMPSMSRRTSLPLIRAPFAVMRCTDLPDTTTTVSVTGELTRGMTSRVRMLEALCGPPRTSLTL